MIHGFGGMACTAGSDRISRTVSTTRILCQVSAAKNVNTSTQYLFSRVNVASGEKMVNPLDFLNVPVPRINPGDPVKRAGEKPRSLRSLGDAVHAMICWLAPSDGSLARTSSGISAQIHEFWRQGAFWPLPRQAPVPEPAARTVWQTGHAHAPWPRARLPSPA
jgi:hypothetical protein